MRRVARSVGFVPITETIGPRGGKRKENREEKVGNMNGELVVNKKQCRKVDVLGNNLMDGSYGPLTVVEVGLNQPREEK